MAWTESLEIQLAFLKWRKQESWNKPIRPPTHNSHAPRMCKSLDLQTSKIATCVEMKEPFIEPILSPLTLRAHTKLILSSYAQTYGLKYRNNSILINGCCLVPWTPHPNCSYPFLQVSYNYSWSSQFCTMVSIWSDWSKLMPMLAGGTYCKVVLLVYKLHRCRR